MAEENADVQSIVCLRFCLVCTAAMAQTAGGSSVGSAHAWHAVVAGLGLARMAFALAVLWTWWATIGGLPSPVGFDSREVLAMLWFPAAAIIYWTVTDIDGVGLAVWVAAEAAIAGVLVLFLRQWPPRFWSRRWRKYGGWYRGASLVAIILTLARLAVGSIYLLSQAGAAR